jgi:hypothetical protein
MMQFTTDSFLRHEIILQKRIQYEYLGSYSEEIIEELEIMVPRYEKVEKRKKDVGWIENNKMILPPASATLTPH